MGAWARTGPGAFALARVNGDVFVRFAPAFGMEGSETFLLPSV
jgi:hypothetical protein